MNRYDEREPLLQVREQVEDLGLDRHVERADRLVEHEQLGLERQRAGDADSLPLAARELVRVTASCARAPRPTRSKQLRDPRRAASRRRFPTIAAARPRSSRAVMRGIERRVRVLEHHLDATRRAQPRRDRGPDVGA